MKTYLLFATSLLFLASTSQSAVLMLDFGPTSVGTATTISPYHSIAPATGTTWNSSLGTGDSSGTLFYSDGSASGISYNLGTGSGTSSSLATTPGSSSGLGSVLNSGIYGGATSSARDAIFNTTTPLSMQISGLAAGTYDIYYVGRNTNRSTADTYTQNIFGASSSTSGNFNWSTYGTSTISYGGANTNTTTWVDGQNFAKLTVTVGTGEFLNLAFTGTGLETRGFLNSLQIVSIPEPSSLLLAALAGMILVSRRKRNAR